MGKHRRNNSSKKKEKKNRRREEVKSPIHEQQQDFSEDSECVQQPNSESEQEVTTVDMATKKPAVRRSARRVLLGEMNETASKNNNAVIAQTGSVFINPSKLKLNEKTVHQMAFERKQKHNLDEDSPPCDKSNSKGKTLTNDSVDLTNKQSSWLKELNDRVIKNKFLKSVGDDSDEMVDQVNNSFRMTVDPGDELDFSFEEDSDTQEETQVSDDNDSSEESSQDYERVVTPVASKKAPNARTPSSNTKKLSEYEQLKNNPEVRKFLELVEKIGGKGDANDDEPKPKKQKTEMGKKKATKQPKPEGTPKGRESRGMDYGKTGTINSPIYKSPSDTTIYRPALKQKRFSDNMEPGFGGDGSGSKVKKMMNNYAKVSDAIEQLRITNFPGDRPGTSGIQTDSRRTSNVGGQFEQQRMQERARNIAEQMIAEAERQKAAITAPTGMVHVNELSQSLNKQNNMSLTVPPADPNFNDDNPNNFTQVTAHVEDNMSNKVKIGGFVEIEKLAPKNREFKNNNTMELIHKDGKAFFVPSNERDSYKITNFQKWELCFRVYAAIYTAANPHRAAEIYQYIHTIHLASQSYSWDNVAYYDFYFRKMMAQNPQRSWAKTYTQLWSLSMREPVSSKTNFVSHGKQRPITDQVCWRFNRNNCKKRDCKFEHRCSYCGIFNHSYLNCRKRKQTESNGETGNNQSKRGTKRQAPDNRESN